MSSHYSSEFIQHIPKADLHLHLDGSLRLSSLIQMAQHSKIALPSNTVEGLKQLVFKKQYRNLAEYLHCFQYTCAVLAEPEHLQQAAYELAIDNLADGVNYIEVRFAPQLLMDIPRGIDFNRVMQAVNNGLQQAQREYNQSITVTSGEKPPFFYGIIVCAMRMFSENFSPFYRSLFKNQPGTDNVQVIKHAAMMLIQASVKLRDEQGMPIVGLDLAGQEAGYPASLFREVYHYAQQHFMPKTVHAGEACGAESVFEAVTECYADRIGHGYTMFMPEMIQDSGIINKQQYIDKLVSFIAHKGIAIEVCLSSNLQTNPAIGSVKQHKIKSMLENKLVTVICTDNRLVSDTALSKEYQLMLDNIVVPAKDLRGMVANGFEKSFFPGSYPEKRDYIGLCMQYYDRVAAQHSIS